MNADLMMKAGFGKEVEAVKAKKCPFCGKDIDMNGFRDELSKKEYGISGLCQNCQDDIFALPEDE
jgi:hypothetical protein